ncbi:hypothetical protein SUDANB95_06794 [Actinosynnema sp. ALI-1.44]
MAPRLTLKRVGAAVLGASLVLASASLPAYAGAVKVTPHKPANQEGLEVFLKEKDGHPTDVRLIGLKISEDGKETTARAYCVELPTLLQDGTPLEEVAWDKHPNAGTKFKENGAKINWILHNSFPVVDEEALSKKLGRTFSDREAIAGTQAAIWHFSDGANLDKDNPTKLDHTDGDGKSDEDVVALYEYLLAEAEKNPIPQEPSPTLEIDPKVVKGKADGVPFGPFKIKSTASLVVFTANLPTGVTLTDEAGDPLDDAPASQGLAAQTTDTELEAWVKVEPGTAPGKADFAVKASAELRHGRLFVSSDKEQKTQSLIIAEPTKVEVKDKVTAEWTEGTQPTTPSETTTTTTTTTTAPTTTTTPAPAAGGGDDDLASTGASIFVPLLIGLGLLGAGAAALIIVRRKKTA